MQLGQTLGTLENTVCNSWWFCDMRGKSIFTVCKSIFYSSHSLCVKYEIMYSE